MGKYFPIATKNATLLDNPLVNIMLRASTSYKVHVHKKKCFISVQSLRFLLKKGKIDQVLCDEEEGLIIAYCDVGEDSQCDTFITEMKKFLDEDWLVPMCVSSWSRTFRHWSHADVVDTSFSEGKIFFYTQGKTHIISYTKG